MADALASRADAPESAFAQMLSDRSRLVRISARAALAERGDSEGR